MCGRNGGVETIEEKKKGEGKGDENWRIWDFFPLPSPSTDVATAVLTSLKVCVLFHIHLRLCVEIRTCKIVFMLS